MWEHLNDKLIQTKESIRKKHKWEKQLQAYEGELAEQEKAITQLERQLTAEQKDVRRLKRISFANLFSTLRGTKEDKLDKEKQEVMAVQLKLDDAYVAKEAIDHAIRNIQQQLQTVQHAEADYEQMLLEKEAQLKRSHSPYAEKLYMLSEQESERTAYLKELDEAIEAGHALEQGLADAMESLDKAKGWGTFDMLGGGFLSTAAKHSHLDTAKESVQRVQTLMRRFQNELLDINETADLHINISGILTFADYFFDGFFVDWMVQGKINKALEQAENQHGQVLGIINELEKAVVQNEQDIQLIQEERVHILESL